MNANVVLFYPRLGWMDAFILDLPLSVIYAAHDCQKNGIEVRIIDQRIEGKSWRESLLAAIDPATLLVGFSAMSGNPILHALEATRLVKQHHPELATVWGGMHVTICPDEAIREPAIDYIIRGLGSKPLYELAQRLATGVGDFAAIVGLGWKDNGQVRLNDMGCTAEYPPLAELRFEGLPMDRYTRFNYKEPVYSLFTSFGCPHNCRFCFAPIFWKGIKGRRWFPYDPDDVIEHVVNMVEEYKVGYISLLDENFFMDLKRAEKILRAIYERGVRVTWGIRGARIDDLDRMTDEMYELMVQVGVRQIMIGAESGSPRVLKELMRKGISPEQTLRVNKRLSRYPSISPSYNFLSGLPGETEEDMFMSVDLILQLMEDNPQASFSGMNQFIPFPGSELFNSCVEHGYSPPDTLDKWAVVDTHYNQSPACWLDDQTHKTLNAIQASLMFADKKAERELSAGASGGSSQNTRGVVLSLLFKLIILVSSLYRPIALFRLRHKFFKFPLDYTLIRLASTFMGKISALQKTSASSDRTPVFKSKFLSCVVLVAVSLALYLPTLNFNYIELDDTEYIYNNAYVAQGLSLETFTNAFRLTGANHFSYWHPLTMLSFLGEVSLFGENPYASHAINVLVHLLSVCLLYLLMSKLFKKEIVAFSVALLFAIHPMHNESVAWVSERKDVLFMFFGLISMYLYILYCDSKKLLPYILCLLAYTLSVSAKPTLVTFFGVLLLLDFWPLERFTFSSKARPEQDKSPASTNFRLLFEKIPFLLIAGLTIIFVLISRRGGNPDIYDPSVWSKFINAIVSYGKYLFQFIYPHDLSIIFPYHDVHPPTEILLSTAILLSVTIATLAQIRKRPYLFVGWFWFIGTLIPVIFTPTSSLHVEYASRYVYFPYIGLYLGICLFMEELFMSHEHNRYFRNAMLAFIFIYLANLSYVSLLNIKTFKDTRSAVENALQHSHGNYVAHTILGKVLMKEGKFADAEAHFNKALAYDPNFVPTLVNLGSLYIRVGLFHEAITLYKQAITIESKTGDIANQAEDNYWTGFCFAQLNDLASAKEYYHKSIALNPEYPLAWNDLGNIDLAEGNYKAAQEKYTRAIRLDPNYAVAKHNLSLANRSGAVSDTKTDTRK